MRFLYETVRDDLQSEGGVTFFHVPKNGKSTRIVICQCCCGLLSVGCKGRTQNILFYKPS